MSPGPGRFGPAHSASIHLMEALAMDTQAKTDQSFLKPEQVADRLEISIDTLAKWRYRGQGPAYTKLNRAVRYPPQALEEFIERRTVPAGR